MNPKVTLIGFGGLLVGAFLEALPPPVVVDYFFLGSVAVIILGLLLPGGKG